MRTWKPRKKTCSEEVSSLVSSGAFACSFFLIRGRLFFRDRSNFYLFRFFLIFFLVELVIAVDTDEVDDCSDFSARRGSSSSSSLAVVIEGDAGISSVDEDGAGSSDSRIVGLFLDSIRRAWSTMTCITLKHMNVQ